MLCGVESVETWKCFQTLIVIVRINDWVDLRYEHEMHDYVLLLLLS